MAHGGCLCQDDHTTRRLAEAIKKSSQVPAAAPDPDQAPAPAPAPLIGSRVTTSQGQSSAEALTVSTAAEDPYTYPEAMEIPQHNPWKRAMEG
jgi:hypothetical protein